MTDYRVQFVRTVAPIDRDVMWWERLDVEVTAECSAEAKRIAQSRPETIGYFVERIVPVIHTTESLGTCSRCGRALVPSAALGFPPICPDMACQFKPNRVDFGEQLADLVKATQRLEIDGTDLKAGRMDKTAR